MSVRCARPSRRCAPPSSPGRRTRSISTTPPSGRSPSARAARSMNSPPNAPPHISCPTASCSAASPRPASVSRNSSMQTRPRSPSPQIPVSGYTSRPGRCPSKREIRSCFRTRSFRRTSIRGCCCGTRGSRSRWRGVGQKGGPMRSTCSNGYRADLKKLGAACRANGTFLVVDGIQGVGNSVLDVRETPIDILACGGQKWLLAPWGSGFVYVRREPISVLEPPVTGWMAFEGTDDFSRLTEYNPTFRSDARRFEMVTLPYQDFYGMTASVGMLAELGIDDIAQYARTLHEPVCRWADETGVRVVSPRAEAHRSAIICLAPAHPVEAYHALKRAHVVCSLREGAIRLAPHCYNTVEELERVLDVLDQLE